jgi:hypothetical protein
MSLPPEIEEDLRKLEGDLSTGGHDWAKNRKRLTETILKHVKAEVKHEQEAIAKMLRWSANQDEKNGWPHEPAQRLRNAAYWVENEHQKAFREKKT